MAKNALITGWGFYAPSRVMTNDELEQIVDTSDEWITSRTGIKERRIASDEETNSYMSSRAARAALEKAHLRAQDVQLVIVGTCSPDYLFPATACLVQTEIGATRAGAFDVEAACTSFITALAIARGMIVSGAIQNALVIGAERLSRLLNWKDRTTCVLFGDGAGAVVLEASNASVGIESTVLHGDGSKGEMLMVQAGASKRPASADTIERGQHFITMAAVPVRRSSAQAARSKRSSSGSARPSARPRKLRREDAASVELEGVPGDAVPGHAIPGDAVPRNAVPSDAVPSDAVPSDAVPSDAVPVVVIPGDAVPGDAAPPVVIPGDAVPADGSPSPPAKRRVLPSHCRSIENAEHRACEGVRRP